MSLATQVGELPVLDTLLHAAKPSSLTKLPWASTEGTWAEATGWSPSSFSASPPTNTRSGFYYNTSPFSGNHGVGLKKTTGSLASEERQFEVWLHYQGGASASGYQLCVVTDKTADGKVKYRLKKFIEGSETLLKETAEGFTFNENDSFYLVRANNKLQAYRRSGTSTPELLFEVEDITFKEGYVGFGGNGSNPKLVNLMVGALAPNAAQVLASKVTGGGTRTVLIIEKPAGVVEGTPMIAVVCCTSTSAGWTPPEGWTLLVEAFRGAGHNCHTAVYEKRAGAGEPASYSWTHSPSEKWLLGAIVAFKGAVTSNPFVDASKLTCNSVPSTEAKSLSITTAFGEELLLHIAALENGATITPPPGFEVAAEQPSEMLLSVKPKATAGETGEIAAALGGSVISAHGMVSIPPAPPSAGRRRFTSVT